MMYGHEKSDHAIVAGKPTNKAEGSAAELVERCRDLGECAPTKHAPDSEPGKRGTGRWLVYGTELPSIPEVGAVCGKAARTDLMQGADALPGSKATSRAKGWYRNLGYFASDRQSCVRGMVRIGKARSRSR